MKLNEVCGGCGLKVTKDLETSRGPGGISYADPCTGILPGVKFACCGHGKRDGYLFFETGVVIRSHFVVVEKQTYSAHHKFNEETVTKKSYIRKE